jgi:hypothetical protein
MPHTSYLFPLFVVAIVLGVIIYVALQGVPGMTTGQVPMTGPGSIVSLVRQDLRTGTPVTLTQGGASITLAGGGKTYHSTFDSRLDILQFLRSTGIATSSRRFRSDVTVNYVSPNQDSSILASILSLVPLLIFAVILLYVMRRPNGGIGR